jgi:hypothetical protein
MLFIGNSLSALSFRGNSKRARLLVPLYSNFKIGILIRISNFFPQVFYKNMKEMLKSCC